MPHETTARETPKSKRTGIPECIMGIVLMTILPLPAQAQANQQQEAAAVMQAAVEYFYYNYPEEKPPVRKIPLERPPEGSLAESVKIIPPPWSTGGQEETSPRPISVDARNALARDLATRLGTDVTTHEEAIHCTALDPSKTRTSLRTEDCRFTDENTRVLMRASVPKVSGSEARVTVKSSGANGQISSMVMRFDLKRGADGNWQVTEAQPGIILN